MTWIVAPGGGGAGVTPDFKWQGWLNGGKNQNPKKSLGLQTNPKKSLDQNLTPQKCHAEFPSHKNFQRNYTARICGEHTQELSHAGTITNLQVVLNTQKHPYLNQPTQKNTCQSFTTEKKTEIENFTPIKILQSNLSLEIQSTPPPPPWMVVHFILGLQNKVVVNSYTIQTKKDITAFPWYFQKTTNDWSLTFLLWSNQTNACSHCDHC